MTLPTLVQKQQNKTILTSLNKTYSELQNIVNLVAYEHGSNISDVVAQMDESQINKLFMSYYDGAADCTDSTCIKNRKVQYYTYTGAYLSNKAGQFAENVYFSKNRFITKEGRLFVFGGSAPNMIYGYFLSVDVNGPFKGPNAWGRDVFTFKIEGKTIKPCGGRTLCSNSRNYNCNASDNGLYSGIGCTYYALTKKGFLDKKYYYESYSAVLE